MAVRNIGKALSIEHIPAFELAILQVLWERGESSVKQVSEHLSVDRAYTTVQTILNIMTRKKRIVRTLSGRAYLYHAKVTRIEVQRDELSILLTNLFEGCASDLVEMLDASAAADSARPVHSACSYNFCPAGSLEFSSTHLRRNPASSSG